MARTASVDESMQPGIETTSERIVSEVADVTDTDPLSLDPLYTVIDPDALDALFESSRTGSGGTPTRIEFTYCDCTVVVTSDGDVSVTPDEKLSTRSR